MRMSGETTIKTMLIDRRTMVRASLAAALECLTSVRICGQAATAGEVLATLEQAGPDVIVLALTGEHDLGVLGHLLSTGYGHLVIVLADATNPQLSIRARQLGALNLLREDLALEHLIAAIENLHLSTSALRARAAERAYGEPLAQSLPVHPLPQPRSGAEPASRIAKLTRREREVVRNVAAGLTSDEIIRQLGITASTFRHHLTSIFKKLEVSNRVELTVFSYRHNITEPHQAASGQKVRQ